MALDCAAVLQPLTRHINTRDLLQLARGFSDTYRDLAQQSTQHFLATPVTALPTGRETGTFLAIDVGGTNLRVGFVKLLGEAGEQNDDSNSTSRHHVPDRPAKIHRCHERAWPIEEHLKMDQADDLFIWIGDCIAAVVREALDDATLRIKDLDAIPLGITFSFPMKQDAISQATLMPMGKGFAITSDLNLGKMLLAGYARHCANGFISPQKATPTLPKLRIAAITNDTVATYASLAYSIKVSSNSRVVMGLVVGTGTNATVPMTVDSLGSFKTQFLDLPTETSPQDAKIVVNTEWSVCGTDIPLKQLQVPTIWDAELDRACDAPGFQPVEYMTAGRYLGELVRLVLVQLLPEQCGCGTKDDLPPTLMRRNSLSTKFLATVVALADDAELKRSLEELYPPRSASGGSFAWTKERMGLLRAAAAAVQVRSAALVAAMIVGLLARVGEVHLDDDDDAEADANGASSSEEPTGEAEEQLIVAHTGGVILQYPGYLEDCEKWIDTLLSAGSRKNSSKRVVLGEAKDGGVIGAAVLAGMFAEAR